MTGSPFNQTLLEKFSKKPEGFAEIRAKSWDRFIQMGLPEKKGAFQYFPLSQLYSAEILDQTSTGAACEENTLVFIDGEFKPELSRLGQLKDLVILPLEEAHRSYHGILSRRFTQVSSEEKDPFALLNLALHSKGAFVFIPPKLAVKEPIRCIHYISRPCFPRVQLFVGARAEVQWISTVVQQTASPLWASVVTDVAVDEGAHCHLTQNYTINAESFLFDATRATLKKQAKFTAISVHRGSKALRQDYKMHLTGEEAEAQLLGLSLLQDNQQSHVHVLMEHEAPHCRSRQHFKTVLRDHSQSSFEGKIYVHPEAQKTEAYQLNNNLILGERAIANSKPNLEIFADDVKASHGATVSQLHADELFYLQTRGIPQDAAKHLLARAFCKEIIEKIPHADVRREWV